MVNGIDRPIANSYWVEPGSLLAGEYPGAPDAERTRDRLDAFLAAAELGEFAHFFQLLLILF